MFRLLRRLLLLVVASFVLAAAVYVFTESFSDRWRGFVTGELAKHGVFLDFKRLTLNPTGGLVAREVRLFNDRGRSIEIASVDRLNLKVDLTELMEGRVHVESLELSHAGVSLPVDPERPDLTVIKLEDFNAKAVLDGNQVDIRQAEGVLSGIRLDLRGVLTLPVPDESADENKKSAMERLSMLREHRVQIQNTLDWLARFQSPKKPLVRVEVRGDLNKPQELKAEVSFHAEQLRYEDYVWRECLAEAEYDSGMIDVKRLHLSDHLGQIEATATWRIGAESARFRLSSTADIPALARTFFEVDALREAVFYEPPQLALEGRWYPGKNKGRPKEQQVFPAEVTGHVDCKRFGSRGAIFEGLSASIGVNADGFYIRDGVLKHKTGEVLLQLMQHRVQGVRYDATLRMDPNVFLPFVLREKTRDVIRRFVFNAESHIDVHVAGAGPSFVLQDGVNSGHGILKRFQYNGVYLDEMEADLHFQGFLQNFRNVRIQHPRGPATADDVFLNDEEKWVRLTNVRAESDTADLLRCFAAKTAAHIEKYRLTHGTEVTVNGTIGIRDPKFNDYTVLFRKPDGVGHYELWREDYTIHAPDGEVRIKNSILSFDVKGRLFEKPFRAQGQTDLTPDITAYNVDVSAGVFPYEVFGKKLDFTGLTADVRARGNDVAFDVKAQVLGGGVTMKGTFDTSREPNPYQGEIRLDAVSFRRFEQTYSKNASTSEGDLSGHLKFTGRVDDWKALKGNGVLIIVNGNLLSVPILGPLTPIIGALLPRPIAGYNIAKEASCNFTVADGFIKTKDLVALTTSFRITSRGEVNFIRDDLDFDAEVRIRGILAIPTFILSELLAYHGTGTVANTKWTPKILGGGGRPSAGEASPPPAAAPSSEPPKKRRSLFGN
ncbi:MAG: hypothetical protein JNG86_13130 [Verrucomicrobiaceae bacterium]|nr:hypothetical protein [Verrucomicrobiaceae bacterium]